MPTRYAIRITEKNFALIRALRPLVDIDVKEDQDRYFLFTVDARNKVVEHDVVHEDDLYNDGNLKEERTILL